ncbi:hypothetical protein [Bartonella sp. DGB1]|uniref:hypothetical protein n=1 Tax=Bartonella sp. DGB1 TaxID=3239807 RepID=UPI0035264B15
MYRKICLPIVFFCCFGLSACGSFNIVERTLTADHGYPPYKVTPIKLSDSIENKVKEAVKSLVKDPYSARYSFVQASKIYVAGDSQPLTYVCGLVNVKNPQGGYVGDTPFFAFTPKVTRNKLPDDYFAVFLGRDYGFSDYEKNFNEGIRKVCKTHVMKIFPLSHNAELL